MSARQLFLLRHAKSAWPDGVEDHERPLAPRGVNAAPLTARHMRQQSLTPEFAFVSTALRTQETWALVRSYFPECAMRLEPLIYEASAPNLLQVIQSADNQVQRLMLVGHNPGLETLARQLIGTDKGDALTTMQKKFPTAALAVLALDIEKWADASPGIATLEHFVTPKMLLE